MKPLEAACSRFFSLLGLLSAFLILGFGIAEELTRLKSLGSIFSTSANLEPGGRWF